MTEIMVLLSEKEYDCLFSCAVQGKESRAQNEDKKSRLEVNSCERALGKMVRGRMDKIKNHELNKLRIKKNKKA